MKNLIFLILFVAVSATASGASFSLKISTQGFGSGSVVGKLADGTVAITCAGQTPTNCAKTLPAGSVVTLTATPAATHTFDGWSHGTGSASACAGTAPCTVTLNAESTVLATIFPPSKLTLRVTGPGKATFVRANGTLQTVESGFTAAQPLLPNSQVSINAIPNSGSNFAGWKLISGSPAGAMCNLNTTPCSFIIDKAIFVEAKFTTAPPPPPPPPVTLTVSKTGSGTVTDSTGMNCGADCSSSVSAGTVITLKASPSSGFTFRNWSNGTGSATVCNNSSTAICRFSLTQNSAITANFLAN